MKLEKEEINNNNKFKNFIDTINNLNPKEIHTWSFGVLTFLGVLILVFMLFIGYMLIISSSLEEVDTLKLKEDSLKKEYVDKLKQAENLDLYKQQLKEITVASDQLLKQLPDKSEIEKLLIYINQAGNTRGLKFEYFKPEQEKVSDYYAELPVKIKVTGNFDAIGLFAMDISQLSRVVILKDINITAKENVITMEATAKTFRYLDSQEIEDQNNMKKKSKDAKDAK